MVAHLNTERAFAGMCWLVSHNFSERHMTKAADFLLKAKDLVKALSPIYGPYYGGIISDKTSFIIRAKIGKVVKNQMPLYSLLLLHLMLHNLMLRRQKLLKET